MSETTKNDIGKTPRKSSKRTPVVSEPNLRGDILPSSKVSGRPPRTLLEPETAAAKRSKAKPKLTPAAREAMDAARKDIAAAGRDIADATGQDIAADIDAVNAADAGDPKRTARAIAETAETARSTAKRAAGSASKAAKTAARPAKKAAKTAAQAIHSDADGHAASDALADRAALDAANAFANSNALTDPTALAEPAALDAANGFAHADTLSASDALANTDAHAAAKALLADDAQKASNGTPSAAKPAPGESKATPSAANAPKSASSAAQETLKNLRASNEAAAKAAKAAAKGVTKATTASDAAESTDGKVATPATDSAATPASGSPASDSVSSATKTVLLPSEKAKKPTFAPPELTAAFLSEDGEALTAVPEVRGPKAPFLLQVTAKAAASVPGTVSIRYTLPAMLEPHIHDGQLDIVLRHNGEVTGGEAYLDWSPSDGKLDLHTRLVLRRGDAFEAVLPVHARTAVPPENGLLVYGEFLTGTVGTDLPLLHMAAHPQREPEVRARLLLEAESGAAEPLPLPEDGRFTLVLHAQAVYASCNLTVALPLPAGLAPVYVGTAPVFLASLDGRIITTRGGLWDGVYEDSAGVVRFTFYDIAPGKALELRLPLTGASALPEEGLALTPILRIGDREEAMDPVHLLPGAFQPAEAAPKNRRRAAPRPIAFCPLTRPI